MEKIIRIALDGPSGSGKSTIAKKLSNKMNILYLDTGAMYRATALKALSLNIDTFDEVGVKTFIDDINLEIKYIDGSQHTYLDGEDVSERIREPHVSMAASNISSLKCVRLKMVEMQRQTSPDAPIGPKREFSQIVKGTSDTRPDLIFKNSSIVFAENLSLLGSINAVCPGQPVAVYKQSAPPKSSIILEYTPSLALSLLKVCH